MELAVSDNKLKKIGSFETKAFQIKASAKAFQILSDSLYSDKYSAIIRELSCNAVDAHKAINQTKQYQIHLPNWYEPNFWIRDYGTGLSKESIESIYTTYFESTKNDSNDYIGCLGLGSKTPFSYTSQFAITSYFNGMKYAYSAFINDEDGCPSVALLGESKTEEPNGLKIEFPIKKEDQDNFCSKAKNVFLWFNQHPEISGQIISLDKIEKHYTTSGVNWHIYNSNYRQILSSHSYVRMGNIGYPIDDTKLPNDFKYKSYVYHPIILDMDIGDVDIAPSREALSYNKKTVASLTARFEKCVNEIAKTINKEINEQKSFADACNFAVKKNYFHNSLISSLIEEEKISYNKRKLCTYISSYDLESIIPQFYHNVEFQNMRGGTLSSKIYTHYYTTNYKIIDIDSNIPKTKIREILYYNNIKDAYILKRKIPIKYREELLDKLGYDESVIVLSSELKTPPKEEVAQKKKESTNQVKRKSGSKAWIYNPKYGYLDGRSCWEESEVIDFSEDNKQKYVFMKLDNFEPHAEELYKASVYSNFLNKLNLSIKIYGLTERQFNKIKNNKNWIPIFSFISEKVQKEFKIEKYSNLEELCWKHKCSINSNSWFNFLPKKLTLKELFDNISKELFYEKHAELQLVKLFYTEEKDKKEIENILEKINKKKSIETWIKEEPDSNLALFIKEFINYPMLQNNGAIAPFVFTIKELLPAQNNNKLWFDYIENIEKLNKKDSN